MTLCLIETEKACGMDLGIVTIISGPYDEQYLCVPVVEHHLRIFVEAGNSLCVCLFACRVCASAVHAKLCNSI